MISIFSNPTNVSIGRSILCAISYTSMAFSTCTIVAVICAPTNLRLRIFAQIASYIAVSDLIFTSGYAIGTNLPPGISCSYQGFVVTMFNLTSCFWATTAVHIIYIIVRNGAPKVITTNQEYIISIGYREHFLCWILPLILTLLPLSTSSYDIPFDDDYINVIWDTCYSVQYRDGVIYLLWSLFTFKGPLAIALCVMVYESVSIYRVIQTLQIHEDNRLRVVQKFLVYAIIVIMTEIFPNFLFIPKRYIFFTNCIYTSAGIFNALWFWYIEKRIRNHLFDSLTNLR